MAQDVISSMILEAHHEPVLLGVRGSFAIVHFLHFRAIPHRPGQGLLLCLLQPATRMAAEPQVARMPLEGSRLQHVPHAQKKSVHHGGIHELREPSSRCVLDGPAFFASLELELERSFCDTPVPAMEHVEPEIPCRIREVLRVAATIPVRQFQRGPVVPVISRNLHKDVLQVYDALREDTSEPFQYQNNLRSLSSDSLLSITSPPDDRAIDES